jgi:Protein of unknown function (DUF4199)
VVAVVLIAGTLYCYNTGKFEGSMVVGYASMILAFSFIFVAVKNLRDKNYGGIISFGKAFKAALLVTLVTSTIYVVVWLLCYYLFIPDFMEKYSSYMLNKIAEKGGTAAELAQQKEQMAMYAGWYKNPVLIALLTYMEILPVGLIVSLIAALILKRKTLAGAGSYATANA